ncbi:MAG: hypothetical protein ACRDNF_26585 [Streptosporangiaceae bacterium]
MTWQELRAAAARETAGMCAPLPAGPDCCPVCRGPVPGGYRRCFHCSLHRRSAAGLLADAVVPLSYSITGTEYARKLRLYKSDASGRDDMCAALRVLLLVFLHDHGRCLWARGGMPAAPSHLAVVPSGGGRSGVHPLQSLAEPYLGLPWADLIASTDELVQARELRIGRFRAAGPLGGATILLLDDTWASGSSAQSAAAALKLAGASSVVTLVLGRHINLTRTRPGPFLQALAGSHFRPDWCPVHEATPAPQ